MYDGRRDVYFNLVEHGTRVTARPRTELRHDAVLGAVQLTDLFRRRLRLERVADVVCTSRVPALRDARNVTVLDAVDVFAWTVVRFWTTSSPGGALP